MLIKSSIFIKASGKFSGNYFQKDINGLHLKALPRHVNSPSNSQKITHKIFQTVRNAWLSHSWTVADLLLWRQYAERHPRFNALGDRFLLTEQLIFYRHNFIRVRNNLPVIFTPPAD